MSLGSPKIKTEEENPMSDKREDNYIESDREREKGHEDTRHKNFDCAQPDEHLGCDPGIDVAG